jgi:hypothetical protein
MTAEKIIQLTHANCVLCALNLSQQLNDAMFFKQLDDDTVLAGLRNRTQCDITRADLMRHKEKHLGFSIKDKIEEIDSLKTLDERISATKKRLKLLDDRGEIYSNSYQTLNSNLTQLLKVRNEFTDGIKVKITGKISVRELIAKSLSENK